MTTEEGTTTPDASTRAKALLTGTEVAADELLELVRELKTQRKFGLARRILEKQREDADSKRTLPATEPLKRKLAQQLSLCTYKDPDLNPADRLDRALAILQELDNLDTRSDQCTADQETLGQAGAIFKRKWEVTAQVQHLQTSLAYYTRGYVQGSTADRKGIAGDFGYNAINAAFLLDLLADLDINPEDRARKIDQARAIRRDIIAVLPGLAAQTEFGWLNQTWWFLATVAEAYVGLNDYEQARRWLAQAAALAETAMVAEWEWEATTRQLARLVQVLKHDHQAAQELLGGFLGERAAGLKALLRGKMGLALSGGGFRASLFHIGMLARLAELDLLRDVEYLSCVSGGSIIGAHYYLEVRNLLQAKGDQEITRQDYIDLVGRVQKDFLDGVQTNVRVQVLSEWQSSLKMIYSSEYSRTNRLGELYEQNIFARIKLLDSAEGAALAPPAPAELYLSELKTRPKGEPEDFSPKDQNWRRSAKVPILILNATPLNTGHNWQFTATWMGEPPTGVSADIDANYRLRRMYFTDAPPPHDRVRLGYAVAASSCVPGLFEPLPLAGLYPGKTVRLVDGGVHDNQGTAALLEQGCNVLLVSDASGQMDAQDDPDKGLLGVPLRSNSILQARLREAQYRDLDARRRSGLLQGLMFIHLKEGLQSRPIDWIGCEDASALAEENPRLPYGVQRNVQEKLAAVRTDLDSFSDAEAYALMTSAYRMTEWALARPQLLGFPTPPAQPQPWKFLEIEDELCKPGSDTPLMVQLEAADRLFLKVWLLSKPLQAIGIAVIVALLALLAYLAYAWWNLQIATTVGQILLALFLFALSATVWKPLVDLLQFRKTIQEVALGLAMIGLGSFLAKLHLKVFDKQFLAQGALARFRKPG